VDALLRIDQVAKPNQMNNIIFHIELKDFFILFEICELRYHPTTYIMMATTINPEIIAMRLMRMVLALSFIVFYSLFYLII
jgi:hypothetical protein